MSLNKSSFYVLQYETSIRKNKPTSWFSQYRSFVNNTNSEGNKYIYNEDL